MDSINLMTEGSYRKKIIYFSLPIFFGTLFQQFYNTADSIIVGNFIGSNALAAVSSSGNLIFMILGFFEGISVGAGVEIARHIGAGDRDKTRKAVHTTVALGLLASMVITLLGIGFTPQILRMMATPAEVMPESITYLRLYFAGALGLVMYNTFVGILQAAGDSKSPLLYLAIASLTNIGLDLLLIGVLKLGVGAAAVATGISQLLSAFLAFLHLFRSKDEIRLEPRKIGFVGIALKGILRNGLPSGFQNSIMAFSNVVIQSYINSFGAMAVAGVGAYSKIEGFLFLPVVSFAMAIATFVSQNLGAGQIKRANDGMRFSMICSLVIAESLGMLLFFFSPQLIGLFDPTPEVISFGVMRARLVTPVFFLCAYTHTKAASLRGAQKAGVSMTIFLICWGLVRVVFLYLAEFWIHDLVTTCLVYPFTWFLSSLALFVYGKRHGLSRYPASV